MAGDHAYVTNQGGRPAKPGEFTALSAGTPIVADPGSAASITGTVSVIDLRTNTVVKNITVGLQPTAILAAGGRVYVANSNSDSVSVIDPATKHSRPHAAHSGVPWCVIRQLAERPGVHVARGTGREPRRQQRGRVLSMERRETATMSADNRTTRWDDDDRRRDHERRELVFEGFVPTAWYPSSVAVVSAQRSACGRRRAQASLSAWSSPTPKERRSARTCRTPAIPGGKNTHTFVGSISIVPLPDQDDFRTYNEQVASNNGWTHRDDDRDRPRPFGERHPIQHVIYVIKENRTYDQVFGDDPRGNGDPSLLQFGVRGDAEPACARRAIRPVRQLLRFRRALRRRPSMGDAGLCAGLHREAVHRLQSQLSVQRRATASSTRPPGSCG